MSTLTSAHIVTRLGDALQDITFLRWPIAELVRYLNDGQREITLLRPDASAKVLSNFMLVPDKTLQTLPADGIRLLDVTRNMGASGSTPGRAIRVVERRILDAQTPMWHTDAASTEIKHYMFDLRVPKNFYVYPKPHASTSVFVELLYSCSPTDLPAPTTNVITDAALNTTLSIDDIYGNALFDYAMYRAYSKDAEYTANAALADAHYKGFVQSIGLKTQSDGAVEPNKKLFPSSLTS